MPNRTIHTHIIEEYFFIFNNMQNRDKHYKKPNYIISLIDSDKPSDYPKHNKDDLSF